MFYSCTRTDPRALTKQRGGTDMIYVASEALINWMKTEAKIGIDYKGFCSS